MKRAIRRCLFESNSSSCHSVTIKGEGIKKGFYHAPANGILEVWPDEYGWHGKPCDNFQTRLSYAMEMVLMREYPGFNYWVDYFEIDKIILENLSGYKLLLNAINKHFTCKEIIIKKTSGYFPYGYIDHQSCEDYGCLQDFLNDWNIDAERFLFDDGVTVIIDNDNH